MDDLISRQAAIDRINKQREHLQPDIYQQDKICDAAYRICAEFIERLPSAQPERKKGKWIAFYHGGTNFTYRCSACGIGCSSEETNFCPYCGAKMEVKKHGGPDKGYDPGGADES